MLQQIQLSYCCLLCFLSFLWVTQGECFFTVFWVSLVLPQVTCRYTCTVCIKHHSCWTVPVIFLYVAACLIWWNNILYSLIYVSFFAILRCWRQNSITRILFSLESRIWFWNIFYCRVSVRKDGNTYIVVFFLCLIIYMYVIKQKIRVRGCC